ncbi:HemK methyltransferase member 2, partial [Cladochytrium tenue]
MSTNIPTPDTAHVWRDPRLLANVYEPAEDTFLLLDALQADVARLHARPPAVCLEIGSGSGCVIAFLAALLGPSSAAFLATDLNPIACDATQQTAQTNTYPIGDAGDDSGRRKLPLPVESVAARLAGPLGSRLRAAVDVLLFNPPYVPTPPEEVGAPGLPAAWAGGVDGREVIDEFLPVVDHLLSPTGVLYLVAVRENRPDELAALLQSRYGLNCE